MKIEDRKRELILRDPQGIEFQEKFKAWLGEVPNPPGATFKLRDFEKYKAEIQPLEIALQEKYCIGVWIPNTTFEGITHDWYLLRDLEWDKTVEDLRGRRDSEHGIGPIIMLSENQPAKIWHLPDLKGYLVFPCPSHKLPILIDTSLITLNDAAKVKKAVWKIVEDELLKRRHAQAKSPRKEPPELFRLMRCYEKTFFNYLRWYDLKMAGLTFRLIATVERWNQDPGKKQRIFEEQKAKVKKTPIHGKVKGESTIRA